MNMRIVKGALIFLVVTTMLVATGQMVFAASRLGTQAPTGEPPIPVNPSFRGISIPAVVGLLYELAGDSATCSEDTGPAVKMTIMMMAEIEKNLFVPVGGAWWGCYWDINAQNAGFLTFLKDKFIPILNTQGITSVPDACFAIKEIKGAVENIDSDFCDDNKPAFDLVEMVIGVSTKDSCP
jgi:hypothetical protein